MRPAVVKDQPFVRSLRPGSPFVKQLLWDNMALHFVWPIWVIPPVRSGSGVRQAVPECPPSGGGGWEDLQFVNGP